MRLVYLSVKLSFLLLTPILAKAQLAPGEDPVYLKEKVVVNMLPLNNTMRSTPLLNSTTRREVGKPTATPASWGNTSYPMALTFKEWKHSQHWPMRF